MATASNSSSSARPRRNDSGTKVTPQLSCELCRERKVKCDKLEPCTTCILSSVECLPIYRQRLPRGRHSQPKTANIERRNQPPPPNRTSLAHQPKPRPLPRDDFLTSDEADVLAAGGSVAGQPPRAELDNNRGPARSSTASRNHSSASLPQEVIVQRDSALLHVQQAETYFQRLFNQHKRSSQLCGLPRRLLPLPMASKTAGRPRSVVICFGRIRTKR